MKSHLQIFKLGLLLGLLLVIFGTESYANTEIRVVFLISVTDTAPNSLQRRLYGSLDSQVDRIIKSEFSQYYGTSRVRVIFHADQTNLWSELQNPENEAVFWVSHAGQGVASAGTGSGGIIMDSRGEDVSSVFASAKLSQNLRYIAVVGCRAKTFVDSLGWNQAYPNLVAQSFSEKVEIFEALKTSIGVAKLIFTKPTQAIDSLSKRDGGFLLTARRYISTELVPEAASSVRLEWKGKVLAVFPPGAPGLRQSIMFRLPVSSLEELRSAKIVVNSGIYSLAPEQSVPAVGEFDISDISRKYQWKVIKMNGRPLGTTQHVYKLN